VSCYLPDVFFSQNNPGICRLLQLLP
jgi:hypothetical protein